MNSLPSRARWFCLLPLAALLAPLCVAHAAFAQCTAQIVAGPVKIRPYAELHPSPVAIVCARNEDCSLQVAVTARGAGCTVRDISLAPLRDPRGLPAGISSVVYREEFLHVFYRSNEEGELGEWPDALIPRVDPIYGEVRNAFPARVSRMSRVYRRYEAQGGRTQPTRFGTGEVVAGGDFRGGLARRYVVRIVRGGAVGEATFIWWSDPGTVRPSAELPTSASPLPLELGIAVQFTDAPRDSSAVQAQDANAGKGFRAGEEFWFYAGPQRQQPFWMDLAIPRDFEPGTYRAAARVEFADQPPLELPFDVIVMPFAMPSTSTLASYFGANVRETQRAHFEHRQGSLPRVFPASATQEEMDELARAYAIAGLRNGITVDATKGILPWLDYLPNGKVVRTNFERFEAMAGPLLAGRGTPRGARWTSLRLPPFDLRPGSRGAEALRAFVELAQARGWLERVFDYSFDEPNSEEDFAAAHARARAVREVEPRIPRLVTTDLDSRLLGEVTRWCPLLNHVATRSATLRQWRRERQLPARADYDARLAADESLWWYQSCESHGCTAAGRGPRYTHWPSYMVDVSAAANRVMGLLSAETYRVSGVLYWDATYAMHVRDAEGGLPSAWDSLYYFGGNGDGTLFYPGSPERIGGTRPIPIESLRLKFIRDSFYDAELVLALHRAGKSRDASGLVGRVARAPRDWSADSNRWLALRAGLLMRLREASKNNN